MSKAGSTIRTPHMESSPELATKKIVKRKMKNSERPNTSLKEAYKIDSMRAKTPGKGQRLLLKSIE